MKKAGPALLVLGFLSVPAAAATICDDLVSQVRSAPGLTTGTESFSDALRPFIKIAPTTDEVSPLDGVKGAALFKKIVADSHAGPELTKALSDALVDPLEYAEVTSLPGNSVAALKMSGGSMNCENFLFFDTSAGKLLSEPPKPAWATGDGSGYLCYTDFGDLAQIKDRMAFVETGRDPFSFDQSLGVSAMEDGRWGPRCSISAKFEQRYKTDKIFIAPDSTFVRADLETLASNIAKAREAASNPANPSETLAPFHFGAPVPEADTGAAREMVAAARKINTSTPLPLFGAPDTEAPDYDLPEYANIYPVVIKGRTYLLRIGHGAIGWRDMPDYALIFYSWKDNALVATASAAVTLEQGPLVSLEETEN